MKKVTTPYEILIRYDATGNVLGAQLQTSTQVFDDDGAVFGAPMISEAFPLTLDAAADESNLGFNLPTVLGRAAADALAMVTDLRARVDTMAAELKLASGSD